MPAMNDVTLVNNDNSKSFYFRAVSPFKVKKSQNVTSIPIINSSAANNVLFRFSGQVEEVSFNFVLFDDGTDVSNSTADGGDATTVEEQIAFLKNEIFTEDYDVSWTLTQTRYFPSGIIGVITDLSIDNSAGGVTRVTGSFTFKRGRIGSLS